METKDWLPVLGIIIGWILSQVGHYFRDTKEEKKLLSVAITSFLYAYFDRVRYREILSVLNSKLGDKLEKVSKLDRDSHDIISINNKLLEQVEAERQSLLRDHPETSSRNIESLNEALKSISEVDPIIAYRARIVIEDDHLHKNMDLSKFLDQPIFYLQQYASLIQTVDCINRDFKTLILKASLRHGIACFVRTVYLIWSENRKASKNNNHVKKFFDETEKAAIDQAIFDHERQKESKGAAN